MAKNTQRLEDLQKASKEYVKTEKKRIENEVKVLEAILKGRTGGKGIQKSSNAVVAAVAQSDLASYLKGK
jgi:hypothetical protein